MAAASLISLPQRLAGAPGAAVGAMLRGLTAQGSALAHAVVRG
jgi:hypothetical protein